MELYLVTNADGHVISSTNGLNWSAPFYTGINIGKSAVGPNKIVYTRCDVEKGIAPRPGLYYTSAWNQTPILAEGTDQYYYNEVHYLGGKFVAVGYENTSPTVPAYAYSTNGVDWTIGQVDPLYSATIGNGNSIEFNDVGYNGIGYFIISNVSGANLAGGFYTTDLSKMLGEEEWANIENFPADANQLVYADFSNGQESFGVWSAFSDDQKTWWSTFNQDPRESWNFVTGWDLTNVLQYSTGLTNLHIAEATIGLLNTPDNQTYVTWMLSTSNGQIIWWPHVPAGPFVSIPSPYIVDVSSVDNLNPLEVTLIGSNSPENNERIIISGSTNLTDLNGVYFVESLGENKYRLHSAVELGSPIDASGWSGVYTNGATAKLSKGVYIDALGYGNGKFFAGNDLEQVFVCTQIIIEDITNVELLWTKVDDLNNSFVYWNDVDYGNMSSCGNTINRLLLTPQHPETIQNYKYTGEGNMDTSIIVDGNGNRVSIQRTGYLETLDGCGNRRVLSVKDGQEYTDAVNNPYLVE